MDWESRDIRCKLLHIEWINNKGLPDSIRVIKFNKNLYLDDWMNSWLVGYYFWLKFMIK